MKRPIVYLPLTLSFIALVLTLASSWDCSYFNGIELPWQENGYGLWTVESKSGNCVLWDTLYYVDHVDAPIYVAKVMAMLSVVFGDAIVCGLALINNFYFINWAIALIFHVLLIVSIATSMVCNLWLSFYLWLHIIIVLTVRVILAHQGKVGAARWQIAPRGVKTFAGLMITCFGCNMLTLVCMCSVFCKNQCNAVPGMCRRETFTSRKTRSDVPGVVCDRKPWK